MTSEVFDDPQFDVFHNEAVDASAFGNWVKTVAPTESVDNDGDIRFEFDINEKYWMGWADSYITLEAQIQNIDTSGKVVALDADEHVILINNGAHSLWSDVKVKINQNAVEGGNSMYPWLAYMNNHINFNQAAKGTHMISQGYHIPVTDTAGNSFTSSNNSVNKAIQGVFAKSKWIYYSFPLKINLFQQGKSLPPGFRLDITLVRNNPIFSTYVMSSAKKPNKIKINVRNVRYHMPMIQPAPRLQTQIAERRKNKAILYQYNHLNCFRQTVVTGTQERTFINVFQSKHPKLAIIGIIESTLYQTDTRKFIFKKHELKEVALRTEGRLITGGGVNCDDDMEVFSKLNQALSVFNSNEDFGCDFDQFKDYSFLIGFDCTINSNVEAIQKPDLRSYDLELKFKTTTSKNYDILIFFVEDKRTILQPNNNVIPNDFISPAI